MNKKIASAVFWRFGEKISAQLVSFVVSVVLARILMPEDYGVVAIVNVFIIIANVFITSGPSVALIQKKNAGELDFSTVFWINLTLSAVIYMVLFLNAPLIASFYNMPILIPILRVLGLKIPISSVTAIQYAYVSRSMDFKKFFFSTIIGTMISAFVGIFMALYGFGVWALVAQNLTNMAIDMAVLFLTVKWRPRLMFSKTAAIPLFRYGWKLLVADLIGTAFSQVYSFIIGKKFTSADLAYYTQGRKIPDLINDNVVGTLSSVLFPAMSQSDSIEEIQKIRRRSLKTLEYTIFPLMFGMIAIADKMVLVLLTEKWLRAVPFVRITCLNVLINIQGITLLQELNAIGRTDITLKLELIKKPVFLGVTLIAMRYGTIAIAYTMVINSALAFIFNVIPVRKYIGFNFKLCVIDMLPNLSISLGMAIPVYLLGRLIKNDLIGMIAQILTGGVLYLVLSVATKNDSFHYLLDYIKNQMGKLKQ